MLNLKKTVSLNVIAVCMCAMSLATADAQFPGQRGPFDTCPSPQSAMTPVIQRAATIDPCCAPVDCGCAETTLVPRQEVTYRNVTETRFRQEQVTRLVPVTVYQQQVATRLVPYTVSRQIPEVRTVYQPQTLYYQNPAYGYRPVTTAQPAMISQPAPQLQAYQSAPVARMTALPPRAEHLDLKQLDTATPGKPRYDDVSASTPAGTGTQRPIGRSAASVFRQFQ